MNKKANNEKSKRMNKNANNEKSKRMNKNANNQKQSRRRSRRRREVEFSDARTLGEWLKWAKKLIDPLDAELIALDTLPLILAGGFGPLLLEGNPVQFEEMDRSALALYQDHPLCIDAVVVLDRSANRRLAKEPMAYIIESKEFYGREFLVTSDVLIPRPETEALIDLVKGLDLPKRPRILDLGTGSGCIAITLALELPQAEILATDISDNALDVAEENDARLEGRVEFIWSDLLDDLDSKQDGPLDVIVANLPYVDPDWDWLDLETLCYEPIKALFAEEGGLAAYLDLFDELDKKRALGRKAPNGKKAVRYLVIEADPCQHKALVDLAKRHGWELLKKQGFGLLFENMNWR